MIPALSDIQAAVAAHFAISPLELVSRRRARRIARPRQIAMYLARELTPQSLPAIGRAFRRDHTTVMHACRVIERELEANGDLGTEVDVLRQVIYDGDQQALPFWQP